MSYVTIYKNCPACNGRGVQTFNTESPVDEPCGRCEGVGYLPWGRLEVSGKIDNLPNDTRNALDHIHGHVET